MSFHVRIDYERTGDKNTQKPSKVIDGLSEDDAIGLASMVRAPQVERVEIEREP